MLTVALQPPFSHFGVWARGAHNMRKPAKTGGAATRTGVTLYINAPLKIGFWPVLAPWRAVSPRLFAPANNSSDRPVSCAMSTRYGVDRAAYDANFRGADYHRRAGRLRASAAPTGGRPRYDYDRTGHTARPSLRSRILWARPGEKKPGTRAALTASTPAYLRLTNGRDSRL